jgi:hypothetical protein
MVIASLGNEVWRKVFQNGVSCKGRASEDPNHLLLTGFTTPSESTISPSWSELVGVQWAAPFVIRVNKGQFARLLGLQTIEGGLFHQQGNFRTHGFVELNREQVTAYCPALDLAQIDFDDVRLLIHQPGIFVKNCTEQQLRELQDRMNERRK